MSLFTDVSLAPADPILGITEAFASDTRPDKVNLGVGVYLDEQGRLPLLECVKEAEVELANKPWSYLPIDGLSQYTSAVRDLVFGHDAPLVGEGRVVTVQSLGGTGALKIGADFLHQINPNATVLVSDPSWENHKALFARAGFEVGSYRYYDGDVQGIDFAAMCDDLNAAAPGTIIVLHACCHNPTGYDLTSAQWDDVIAIAQARGLVCFLDMAYQGFGVGLREDGAAVAKFARSGMQFFVSNSFSKTFSLYGERVGALSIVCASEEEAIRVRSRVKIVIRTTYSNPPTHGAAIVGLVLTDPKLRGLWESELGAMRERINQLRVDLVNGLTEAGVSDMEFVATQQGMFSYSGLSAANMQALRAEQGIYGLDSGRICVAAINAANIERIIAAIVALRS